MILLTPFNPSPNTMYYTFDNTGEAVEVWFDRIDRTWVLPLEGIKRPAIDNPVSKTFSKEEFKKLFK